MAHIQDKDLITLEYTDVFDNNQIKNLVFSKHLINKEFKKDSLFALLIDGQSMEPKILHKSVLVADLSQKELIDKAIYLLYYENRMWVKSYDKKNKSFISLNEKFSHLVYKQDEIHLVARVLLTFTNL